MVANYKNFVKNFTKTAEYSTERKVEITSSPYGPYELGYTRATMGRTAGDKNVSLSKSLNLSVVRIEDCNSSS